MVRIRQWLSLLFQNAAEYHLASRLFLKLLALIYCSAFLSLTGQITGLVGSEGIFPVASVLANAAQHLGSAAWLQLPTLFWLDSGDAALKAAAWAGCAVSLALFFGILPRLCLILLFGLYLSLVNAGQIFLNFQWDYLLLESGFLAIFLVGGPSRLTVLMFHWLLFRLRFMSGLGKLASGDPSWSSLTALNYYFETQPLPHVGSWYAHQLPEWLLYLGTALTLFSELIVPLFIFLSRRWRLTAAAITIGMQLLIIATSNHNFINLLTIALCLFLLDDECIKRVAPFRYRRLYRNKPDDRPLWTNSLFSAVGAVLIFSSSLPVLFNMVTGIEPPRVIAQWHDRVRRFGIGNAYHVFPTMQTERIELIIEGSADGTTWQAYLLPWQPGAPGKRPAFIVPHQPRLDWMMWFVPTQQPPGSLFFDRLMHRLAQSSPTVTALFERDPFGGIPPTFLRVSAYRYRFTTPAERTESGNWWQREYLGLFPWISPRQP